MINYITADPPAKSSGSVSLTGGQGKCFTGKVSYGNTFGNTGFQINYLRINTTAFGYTTSRNWRRQDFADNSGASNLTVIVWGDESISGGAIFLRNST